jgi:hypothetical protein
MKYAKRRRRSLTEPCVGSSKKFSKSLSSGPDRLRRSLRISGNMASVGAAPRGMDKIGSSLRCAREFAWRASTQWSLWNIPVIASFISANCEASCWGCAASCCICVDICCIRAAKCSFFFSVYGPPTAALAFPSITNVSISWYGLGICLSLPQRRKIAMSSVIPLPRKAKFSIAERDERDFQRSDFQIQTLNH